VNNATPISRADSGVAASDCGAVQASDGAEGDSGVRIESVVPTCEAVDHSLYPRITGGRQFEYRAEVKFAACGGRAIGLPALSKVMWVA
jgi:hypothetical protein